MLDKQEQETILQAFNADTAWEIGSLIRQRSIEYAQPVAIQIVSTSGMIYFHANSRPGVNLDNQAWLARKIKTVVRFGRSSFYMGCKLRKQGRSIESAFGISESEFSVHGGGFPIRVRGTEGVVAVAAVSGLRQEIDHALIYESLKEYIATLNIKEDK